MSSGLTTLGKVTSSQHDPLNTPARRAAHQQPRLGRSPDPPDPATPGRGRGEAGTRARRDSREAVAAECARAEPRGAGLPGSVRAAV